jgi:hypothetical protein
MAGALAAMAVAMQMGHTMLFVDLWAKRTCLFSGYNSRSEGLADWGGLPS